MKKNIAEILKYCREGLPLWSPAYGNVHLEVCTDSSIIVRTNCGKLMTNAEGMLCSDGECVLFPSKEQRDWDKFWPYEDGDVLYAKVGKGECVFIYWEQGNKDFVGRYLIYMCNREDLYMRYKDYLCRRSEINTIRYATEEEIDALYGAIEKEGKIWDPVKKGLINIEIVAAEEKAEKFDINTLKPFDRVLVRDDNTEKWTIELWMAYAPSHTQWKCLCLGSHYAQCIPYEGNEHLLRTEDMPDEYYITWEEEK